MNKTNEPSSLSPMLTHSIRALKSKRPARHAQGGEDIHLSRECRVALCVPQESAGRSVKRLRRVIDRLDAAPVQENSYVCFQRYASINNNNLVLVSVEGDSRLRWKSGLMETHDHQ